jgi:hypothetical protein
MAARFSEPALEEIELMRGGDVVSTLTGAFGQSLKETRLTALLGYLIALNPKPFLSLFGFIGTPQRVCLEERHDQGRSDILVETSYGKGIIEAKVDATDPLKQSLRYPARWIALLTHRAPQRVTVGRARYVSWQQLAELLEKLGRSGTARVRYLSKDLLNYMQVHHMTKNRESVEIYAREINEPVTLELFLKAQLYGCNYDKGSRLSEALYFAPHFGAQIANDHPGVNIGISYIARIESVGIAATWQEFKNLMREKRGGTWLNQHKEVLRKLRSEWTWDKKEQRYFLLLGKPRLAFNPPVRKEGLQKGKGWLSKRFLSFDELYNAWGQRI